MIGTSDISNNIRVMSLDVLIWLPIAIINQRVLFLLFFYSYITNIFMVITKILQPCEFKMISNIRILVFFLIASDTSVWIFSIVWYFSIMCLC